MLDILAIIIALVLGLVAYVKWKLTYWDRTGVPTLDPVLFYGDAKPTLTGKSTFGDQVAQFYQTFKGRGLPHGGVYVGIKPFYMPIDPELIKHVVQIDFQHFVNHGNHTDEEIDPLSAHLFNLEDAKWRNMRIKLTPTFTSGKLKMMFETFLDCAEGLKFMMNESAESKTPIEIKEVLARFTTDIIGSVAFGLKCNSLKDPDAEFRKYGKKVFEGGKWERLKQFLQFVLPRSVIKAFKIKITKPDVEEFFMKVVQDTVDYREKNNVYRKDFMHLLIQLKNRGTVADDGKIIDDQSGGKEKGLTMKELAAQAFVFFIAGFETSSTTMTFALYELGINPEIQVKLREEINTVLAQYDDQLTYAAIMEMTYMDKVIHETLRKYPPVPFLFRECTKNYTIPNTDMQIKKGAGVIIPSKCLHMDPDYYPNPDVFDPERFSEENKKKRPGFTWLPFGEGPRLCIGMRFGLLQAKVGITTLLRNYKVSLSKRTKTPITFDRRSFIASVEGGVWLDVKKL